MSTRKRRVKPGNLHDLQRVLWATILEVEALLEVRPCSTDVVFRAAHALAQLSSSYRAVTEIADLETRIQQLERAAGRNGRYEFS
jgi:D-alanyl-D-alanine carboxypeptidase